MLVLALDRFKLVNDSLGHVEGDRLLVETARRLSANLRPDDCVARFGGDEFAVLLTGHDVPAAEAVARRLLAAVREPVELAGRTLSVTASIGLAAGAAQASFEPLLRDADAALYRAKEAGRDRTAWFDAAAHSALLDRIALEADPRGALDAGSIDLHYQPVFGREGTRAVGAEALARWTHPERGPCPRWCSSPSPRTPVWSRPADLTAARSLTVSGARPA